MCKIWGLCPKYLYRGSKTSPREIGGFLFKEKRVRHLVAEGSSLLSWRGFTSTVGSNPTGPTKYNFASVAQSR